MSNKKSNDYFDSFNILASDAKKSADLLYACILNFDGTKMEEHLAQMHEIEHAADIKKHEMMDKLAKEFIPPIEREDINRLLHAIESVSDAVEDVLLKMYIFCISEVRPEAKQFADILVRSCEVLKKMMIEFPNYKKSIILQKLIIEINDLEEEGDQLYKESLHTLYATSKDAVELLVWTELMDRFEKSCDSIEYVANVVESVVMNNI